MFAYIVFFQRFSSTFYLSRSRVLIFFFLPLSLIHEVEISRDKILILISTSKFSVLIPKLANTDAEFDEINIYFNC